MTTTAMIIDNFTDGAKPCRCEISASDDGKDLVMNFYDFIIHVGASDVLGALDQSEGDAS